MSFPLLKVTILLTPFPCSTNTNKFTSSLFVCLFFICLVMWPSHMKIESLKWYRFDMEKIYCFGIMCGGHLEYEPNSNHFLRYSTRDTYEKNDWAPILKTIDCRVIEPRDWASWVSEWVSEWIKFYENCCTHDNSMWFLPHDDSVPTITSWFLPHEHWRTHDNSMVSTPNCELAYPRL